MKYTYHRVNGQNLMFHIVATHNNKQINFNVVCSSDESEIHELVLYYFEMLDSKQPTYT